jgi:hypothetical protein
MVQKTIFSQFYGQAARIFRLLTKIIRASTPRINPEGGKAASNSVRLQIKALPGQHPIIRRILDP